MKNSMKNIILCFIFFLMFITKNSFAATGTILTSAGGSLESGSYYLNSNITLTNNIVVPSGKTVTIDLNGYVLKGNGTGSVITNNGTLVIEDSNPTKINKGNLVNRNYTMKIDGESIEKTATNAIWQYNETGNIEINGGLITGGNVLRDASMIKVSNTTGGGGIHNLGNLTIEGGNIAGCEVGLLQQAGAIYIGDGASATMNGGKILYNWSSGHSAGVYIYSGTFTMNAGEISYNAVGGTAGAVRVGGTTDNKGTFIMNDGILSNNRALGDGVQTGNGGGVYCENGNFTFNGGEISKNTANNRGGGIDIWSSGTFEMAGKCIVKDNVAGYLRWWCFNSLLCFI